MLIVIDYLNDMVEENDNSNETKNKEAERKYSDAERARYTPVADLQIVPPSPSRYQK